MRPNKIAGHVFDVLSRSAGDLSWQDDPDTPPACVPPPDAWLYPAALQRWFGLWDSAGPGQVSHRSWVRIRRAVDVCQSCPLRNPCLAYALDRRTKAEGVWGGMYFPANGPAQHPPRRRDVAA